MVVDCKDIKGMKKYLLYEMIDIVFQFGERLNFSPNFNNTFISFIDGELRCYDNNNDFIITIKENKIKIYLCLFGHVLIDITQYSSIKKLINSYDDEERIEIKAKINDKIFSTIEEIKKIF